MPTIYKPKKQQRNDSLLDTERKKIYQTERWRRLRAVKVSMNPLCELCEKDGKVTPAEDVHHIRSFMRTDDPVQRNFLAYDFDNLMSLCKKCHQEIHNKKY